MNTASDPSAPPTRDPSSRRFGWADVFAGISVGLIVIPQGLAYAEIAGMPPWTGLYAAALPAIAAAPFASSRYLQTGPVAMTALLSFGVLSTMAEPASPEYVGLAVLLAMLVGIIRLILGLSGGGAITNYMSPSVILGFTSAATLLIVASQSPTIFGRVNVPDGLIARLFDVISNPGSWDWAALGMAALTAAILLAGSRLGPRFPAVLVAVIAGLLVSRVSGYSAAVIGSIPESLPPLSLSMPWERTLELVMPAAIIATVGFAEPTAIARTMALQDRERWNADRELVSQGLANIASGVSGGFPVGGSFSRSGMMRFAGAQTRWAGAVTGLAVLAFMPFAGILSDLPRAVLGAIVVAAVVGLIRVPDMVRLARVSWGQTFVAWTTALATLVLAPRVDLAILVGVFVAAAVHIFREASRTRVTTKYEAPELEIGPGGVLFYGSAAALEEALSAELVAHPEAERLTLDLSHLGRIDHSGVIMLQEFARDARDAGLEVVTTNVPRHAAGIIERSGGI